jgi:hypothetical protein
LDQPQKPNKTTNHRQNDTAKGKFPFSTTSRKTGQVQLGDRKHYLWEKLDKTSFSAYLIKGGDNEFWSEEGKTKRIHVLGP